MSERLFDPRPYADEGKECQRALEGLLAELAPGEAVLLPTGVTLTRRPEGSGRWFEPSFTISGDVAGEYLAGREGDYSELSVYAAADTALCADAWSTHPDSLGGETRYGSIWVYENRDQLYDQIPEGYRPGPPSTDDGIDL